MHNWKLYTGDIPCAFIDEIDDGIDFVLIDTIHVRPGEITDFLSVLPYLKENAIVCFHDIGASFSWGPRFKPAYYCNDILFSCIKGEKMLPKKDYYELFSNIDAIKLDKKQNENFLDYFFFRMIFRAIENFCSEALFTFVLTFAAQFVVRPFACFLIPKKRPFRFCFP